MTETSSGIVDDHLRRITARRVYSVFAFSRLVPLFLMFLLLPGLMGLFQAPASARLLSSAGSGVLRGEFGSMAHFGRSMANAGDINGDGHEDVIVGAPGTPAGAIDDVGMAYIFYGSDTGISGQYVWSSQGDAVGGAQFGFSVAGAGDVNGDGFDDVLVGAYAQSSASVAEGGKVFLYLGSASGLSDVADWASTGDDEASAHFGSSVAGVGDVNNDSYDDMMIGAYMGSVNGKAFLYLGSVSGPSMTPAMEFNGNATDSYFGGSVAGIGDINADGYDDVAVGCTRPDAFPDAITDMAGSVRVYSGSTSGSCLPVWNGSGSSGDLFGYSISGQDVNGDGYSDLLVGAPGMDGELDRSGAVLVYLSDHGNLSGSVDMTLRGIEGSGAGFGCSVDKGDMDTDGVPDTVVGEYNRQRAWLFPVSNTTLCTDAKEYVQGATGSLFSFRVVVIESSNGSASQLVASDPLARTHPADIGLEAGEAYVYDVFTASIPDAITDLVATALPSGEIRLTWTPTLQEGYRAYSIFRDNGTNLSRYMTVKLDEGNWTDTDVSNGTMYRYAITQWISGTEGYMSDVVSATSHDSTPPPHVTGLTVRYRLAEDVLRISFEPVSSEVVDRYVLEWSNGTSWSAVGTASGNSTTTVSIDVTLFDKDGVDRYRVVTYDKNGLCSVSAEIDTGRVNYHPGSGDGQNNDGGDGGSVIFTETRIYVALGAAALMLILIVIVLVVILRRRGKDHAARMDAVMSDQHLSTDVKQQQIGSILQNAGRMRRKGKLSLPQYADLEKKADVCFEQLDASAASDEPAAPEDTPPPPMDDEEDLPPPPDDQEMDGLPADTGELPELEPLPELDTPDEVPPELQPDGDGTEVWEMSEG